MSNLKVIEKAILELELIKIREEMEKINIKGSSSDKFKDFRKHVIVVEEGAILPKQAEAYRYAHYCQQ